MLKKLFTLFLSIVFLSSTFAPSYAQAQEFDPDFNQAKIISDFMLFDYTTMSLGEIQQFLEQKNSYLATYITEDFEGNVKSASEIIYEAAQNYQVNPQYILVLLQKEQGLIQMENPTEKRLSWATGYAVCDSCSMDDPRIQKYKGFGKQVDNGAGAMRFYYENASRYEYIKSAGGAYEIDGETIIFENQATANLYTYTPHIRGNYTFWRVWQSYFGDPLSEVRTHEATTQTEYMAQIIGSAPFTMEANEGEEKWYWVEYLNIGTQTWDNDDLNNLFLVEEGAKYSIPFITKTSEFNADEAKLDEKYDVIYAQKEEVKPGEVLRISIPIKPTYEKSEQGSYVLAIDGKGWFADSQVDYTVQRKFRYDAQLIDDSFPAVGEPHTRYPIEVKYQNVGTQVWNKSDVYLQWQNLTVDTTNRIQMAEESVAPGETATFTFTTSFKDINYNYRLTLLKKINAWKYNRFPTGTADKTIGLELNLAAQIIDFQVPETMSPGQEYYARILMKNTGGSAWKPEELVLRSYKSVSPFTRSHFHNDSWISGYAIHKVERDVKPGELYEIMFKIVAPTTPGTYPQYYQFEWGDTYKEIDLGNGELYKKVTTQVQ